jgi:hypothetical protein
VTPPALEIADLIRTAGAAFVERNRQWIRWKHVKTRRIVSVPSQVAAFILSGRATSLPTSPKLAGRLAQSE